MTFWMKIEAILPFEYEENDYENDDKPLQTSHFSWTSFIVFISVLKTNSVNTGTFLSVLVVC